LRLPESKRGRRVGIGVAVLAVIAFWVVVNQVIPHDNLQKLLEDVSNALGAWTYLWSVCSPSWRRARSWAWWCPARP
jgi:hypothetical protein